MVHGKAAGSLHSFSFLRDASLPAYTSFHALQHFYSHEIKCIMRQDALQGGFCVRRVPPQALPSAETRRGSCRGKNLRLCLRRRRVVESIVEGSASLSAFFLRSSLPLLLGNYFQLRAPVLRAPFFGVVVSNRLRGAKAFGLKPCW